MELLPHNDYLRLFYDTGALGLLVYLNMLAFVLRLVMRSTTTENDFSLLAFLLIACFCITDNFIYFTMPMFVYVFLGSYAHRPAAAVGCALHVREGASRSYPSSAEGKA
jgi:O-antigen ligase